MAPAGSVRIHMDPQWRGCRSELRTPTGKAMVLPPGGERARNVGPGRRGARDPPDLAPLRYVREPGVHLLVGNVGIDGRRERA